MSTSRGLAALLTLLALWSCAPAAAPPTEPPPHPPTDAQGPAWPTPQCEPDADADQRRSWRPRQLDQVGPVPPVSLLMPVEGALVADVYPSFGDPRSGGRLHEGVDIMAPRGTPVRAAAPGYVVRVDADAISVTTVGDGGIRYFYTHFDSLPAGLVEGQYVYVDTVIGYVGNTGNAAATAPHLHSLPASATYSWYVITQAGNATEAGAAPYADLLGTLYLRAFGGVPGPIGDGSLAQSGGRLFTTAP